MKNIIVFAIFCISGSVAACQSPESVLSGITEKFQKYVQSYPREEVFVQTDRDIYIAGEDIWLNLWLFDRQRATLTDKSKIAYLEILNTANRPVVQKKIGLDNGCGKGKMLLPDTLKPGVYTLRAYTSWMKNFMPDNCFIKRLEIYSDQKDQVYFVPDEDPRHPPFQNVNKESVDIKLSRTPGTVEAVIVTNDGFRSKNNNTGLLFVETHGKIDFRSVVSLNDSSTSVHISSSDLTSGVNHFTLFDISGKPVKEAFTLTGRDRNQIRELKIEAPDSCIRKEKISLILQNTGNEQGKDTAFLTVSVVPAGTGSLTSVSDYMLFGSEFGKLPDTMNGKRIENISDSIISEFLSGAKSSWINWDIILSGSTPELRFNRENKYYYLYGLIPDYIETESKDKNFVFLSIPGKHASFQYSRCDRDGRFFFSIPPDDKLRDLIIQSSNPEEKNKPAIQSSFYELYPLTNSKGHNTSGVSPLIRQMGINYRTTRIYKSFDPPVERTQQKFTSATSRFYAKPDFELKMEDYIKLPTMQEVFFELLPGASLKQAETGYKATIKDKFDSRTYDNPGLMIDGVIIKDPDKIAGIDPASVEKIDLIKSRYVVGDYIFSGIINVITARMDLGNITLPENILRTPLRVLEPVDKFSSPVYTVKEPSADHLPDFRNTLFWDTFRFGLNETGRSIEFYSSDFSTDYDIIIQGVTKDGKSIFAKKSLKITR